MAGLFKTKFLLVWHLSCTPLCPITRKQIGLTLRKACEYEYDADRDAIHLAKATNIVRREIFKMKNPFNGSVGNSLSKKTLYHNFVSTGHNMVSNDTNSTGKFFFNIITTNPYSRTLIFVQQLGELLGGSIWKNQQAQSKTINTFACILRYFQFIQKLASVNWLKTSTR